MASPTRPFDTQPIPDESVEYYRETVKNLVSRIMEHVAAKNNIFTNYQILLSGSTSEDVRVGNPYEIDYLIQYEVDVDKIIEVYQYPGFVMMKPSQKDRLKFESVMERQFKEHLSCDRLLFCFLKNVFDDILDDFEVLKTRDEARFQLDVHYNFEDGDNKKVNVNNFRRITGIGAAIPFLVTFPTESDLNSSRETIDVVLSLHCQGYWPECADAWKKKYKKNLKKECYDAIIEYGVSMVCKSPVEDTFLFENTPMMFRISFSFAESKLMQYVTEEQKEAYRYLKILRETSLTDYIFFNVDIGDQLKKRFTSYHLKTIFFYVSYENKRKRKVRQWLVRFLNRIIRCLRKRSMTHHFITGIDLLKNTKLMDVENFKYNYMLEESFDFEDFKSNLPPEYINKNTEEIDAFAILKTIFMDILKSLPKDLSKLKEKCSYKNEYDLLPGE